MEDIPSEEMIVFVIFVFFVFAIFCAIAVAFKSDDNNPIEADNKVPQKDFDDIILDFFKNNKLSHFVVIFLVETIILVVAMCDLRRSTGEWYYPLLRLISCGVSVYSLVKFKTEWVKWIFGGLAVLYNPIFPMHLGDKDAWAVVNALTIVYLWVAFCVENKKRT